MVDKNIQNHFDHYQLIHVERKPHVRVFLVFKSKKCGREIKRNGKFREKAVNENLKNSLRAVD